MFTCYSFINKRSDRLKLLWKKRTEIVCKSLVRLWVPPWFFTIPQPKGHWYSWQLYHGSLRLQPSHRKSSTAVNICGKNIKTCDIHEIKMNIANIRS